MDSEIANKIVSQNIKKLRRKAGLTQRQTAEYLKVSYSWYRRMENNQIKASIVQIFQLAEIFGVSFADILNVWQ